MWQYVRGNELYHHGILGMRWGVRRFQKSNGSLTKAGQKRYTEGSRKTKDDEKNQNGKSGLTDKQKRAIKIGAAVAVTALAAYGAYRMKKSGKLDKLVALGKDKADDLLGRKKAGSADDIGDFGKQKIAGLLEQKSFTVSQGIRKLTSKESLSDTLSKANPLKGTKVGTNNCVPSSIASFLRQAGFDVVAKGTGGKPQNTAGVVEECFKGAKIIEGSAMKFGRSPKDAAEMLVKKFGDNADGICSIEWIGGGGHCFSWKTRDGSTSFFDSQKGLLNVSKYFKAIDKNGNLTLARLDESTINWEALSNYVEGR